MKLHITIRTDTDERKMSIADDIHSQLVGNPDYIESNIVLNCDKSNEVNLYVFEECKNVPKITIRP